MKNVLIPIIALILWILFTVLIGMTETAPGPDNHINPNSTWSYP